MAEVRISMIVLYTALLFVLGVVRCLLRWRVRVLEKAYSRVSLKTAELANQPHPRQGNSNRPSCEIAKTTYELGKLVHQRDRLEAKHFRWQSMSEKFGRFVGSLRQWKGKKLPYACGVLDVSLLWIAIDRFGFTDQINLDALQQLLSTWISG